VYVKPNLVFGEYKIKTSITRTLITVPWTFVALKAGATGGNSKLVVIFKTQKFHDFLTGSRHQNLKGQGKLNL